MTISYSGNFFKLLLRWKGSIWKAVYRELTVFLLLYFIISCVYRFAYVNRPGMKDAAMKFEELVILFDSFTQKIPIEFLLGFYVTAVVRRWWEQFQHVAWPDDVLSYVCILIPGNEEAEVYKRRTIARWLNLTASLAWRDISKSVRRRFPTMNHLIKAGLMTKEEINIYDQVQSSTIKWSLPIFWIRKAVDQELAKHPERVSSPMVAMYIRELNTYKNHFKSLYCYDWVCIPLVYTQVAALATYGYFTICLIGRQFIDPSKGKAGNMVDLYIPIFTILQFLFFVGWFKVGQYLMRPFEEDDDDIELNYMLDRHIQTAFSIVDEVMRMDIPVVEDSLSHCKVPAIPYTRMSIRRQQHPPKLHAHVNIKNTEDEELVENFSTQERRGSKIRHF